MSNRTVQAAAEGMPSLSRRLFLRGAAVIAPALAIPATAALASSYVEENSALLALEPELNAAMAEAVAAKAAYAEALRIGREMWSRAPSEITRKIGDYDLMGRTLERDITGAGYGDRMSIIPRDQLVYDLRCLMRKRKITPEVEAARSEARRRIDLLDAYTTNCARAKEVSGYTAADERWTAANKALVSIVGHVQAKPCKTMAGIRLKAKALDGWDRCARYFKRLVNLEGRERWMPDFCRALVEVLEAA